jgi:hypothetical protein
MNLDVLCEECEDFPEEIDYFGEGYDAFYDHEPPAMCPYLNPEEHEFQPYAIQAWMRGWTEAFQSEIKETIRFASMWI